MLKLVFKLNFVVYSLIVFGFFIVVIDKEHFLMIIWSFLSENILLKKLVNVLNNCACVGMPVVGQV